MTSTVIPRGLYHRLRRLIAARSGVAAVEFALSLPLLLIAGLFGVEVANYAVTYMRINQIAMQIADDGSRIGDQSMLVNKTIFENDINDLLIGGYLQGGTNLDLYRHGRAIVSSLEVWDQSVDCSASGPCPAGSPNKGTQFIHWQRCRGLLAVRSVYGTENSAQPKGMGPAGSEVTANPGDAVIFVELTYQYQPLITAQVISNPLTSVTASFVVRDSRDLSGLKQRNVSLPDPVSDCRNYTT